MRVFRLLGWRRALSNSRAVGLSLSTFDGAKKTVYIYKYIYVCVHIYIYMCVCMYIYIYRLCWGDVGVMWGIWWRAYKLQPNKPHGDMNLGLTYVCVYIYIHIYPSLKGVGLH